MIDLIKNGTMLLNWNSIDYVNTARALETPTPLTTQSLSHRTYCIYFLLYGTSTYTPFDGCSFRNLMRACFIQFVLLPN
jgi:hypothetical protein